MTSPATTLFTVCSLLFFSCSLRNPNPGSDGPESPVAKPSTVEELDPTEEVPAGPSAPSESTSPGDFDSTFNGGSADIDWGEGAFTRAMLVQPDGKVVLAGMFKSYAALGRLNTDGTVDKSFGTDGKMTLPAIQGTIESISLHTNGDYALAGKLFDYAYNPVGYIFAARVSPKGTVTSFAKSQTLEVRSRLFGDAVLQPDGQLIVAYGATLWDGAHLDYLVLMRFGANGGYDSDFGTDGFLWIPIYLSGFVEQDRRPLTRVALQSDGKLIIAINESGSGGIEHSSVIRITAAGELDSTFDTRTNGQIFGSEKNEIRSVCIDAQNRILVAGSVQSSDPPKFDDHAVARLKPDGRLDTYFGDAGRVRIDFATDTDSTDLVFVDPLGRIGLVGTSTNGRPPTPGPFSTWVVAMRLLDTGVVDSAFGSNGKVTVTNKSPHTEVAVAEYANGLVHVVPDGYSSFTNGHGLQGEFAVLRVLW